MWGRKLHPQHGPPWRPGGAQGGGVAPAAMPQGGGHSVAPHKVMREIKSPNPVRSHPSFPDPAQNTFIRFDFARMGVGLQLTVTHQVFAFSEEHKEK